MKDSTFTIDQIGKLREIERARIKDGQSGLRSEVQELISRLTSGGVGVKTDDPREAQAKRLWDKGFGRELKMLNFDEYLATIPEIPESLTAPDDRLPELVFVDARLGIVKTCELLGVGYGGNDKTFADFDPKQARTEKVYWIRAQDGKKNRGKSVRVCREGFAKDEFGLTVHEGLALLAQNSDALRDWAMDITGSVDRNYHDLAACLNWFCDRPKLDRYWDGNEFGIFGSGSRRE